MFILFNSQIINADRSFLETFTPGILKAKGVFETIRVYKNGMFGLDKHLKRMREGLKFFHLKMPYSLEEWSACVHQLLILNHLKEARVRLMAWQAKNKFETAIICQPLSILKENQSREGFKASLLILKKDKRQFPHIKSLDYAFLRKAFLAAKRQGTDEAILVNKSGFLTEGTRSNIFFVKQEILYTPALQTGCLRGITRGYVIELAKDLGILCKAVQAKPKELFEADEAFLTNSVMEIMPLVKVENTVIGRGEIGPITCKIIKAYKELKR